MHWSRPGMLAANAVGMTDAQAEAQAPNRRDPRAYRVVVGTDLSALGDRAVLESLKVCDKFGGSELHVISVAEDKNGGIRLPGQDALQDMERAEAFLCSHVGELAAQYVNASGTIALDKIAIYVATGLAAQRIVTIAENVDADLIVVGTHGRSGIKRLLLGSVAEEVVRRAPCAVFVVRPRDFLDGEKVLDVQPPLLQGEHQMLPFRQSSTYHYIDRAAQATQRRMMPAS